MKKVKDFKVGDWAKVESLSNRVVKIRSIGGTLERVGLPDEREMGFVIDGQVVYTDESNMIKLPIKFKAFEIYGNAIYEKRLIKNFGHYTRFQAQEINTVGGRYFVDWGNPYHNRTKFLPTIEQAKDWLELEYVKMLIKAKELS